MELQRSGGVQRSSLSLVVIILEGTGAVQQLLPIILTTVVAKWVGDLFNDGLNTTALAIKRIPFLVRPVPFL
jgi:H+/Cl- antiporter ClcA